LTFPGGLRVSFHLDLLGRLHEKFIVVTGDRGTLHWSYDPNRIRFGRSPEQVWQDEVFAGERNDMFVEVAREFLDVVVHRVEPSCTIEDGIEVLRVIEAMRISSAERRT